MENDRIKILAVDESRDDLASLKSLIEKAFPKAAVAAVSDETQALALAAQTDTDIFIVRMGMPGIDGYGLCRRLKEDDQLKDRPVLFAAYANAGEDDRLRALECGADGFISIPFYESEIKAQIRAMAKIRAAAGRNSEKEQFAELIADRTRELIKAHEKERKLSQALKDENETRRKSENALLEAQRLAHMGSFEQDIPGNWLKCTDEVLAICGFLRDAFPEKIEAVMQLVHPEDYEAVVQRTQMAVEQKQLMETGFRILRPDGELRYINIRMEPLYDLDGNHIKNIGTIQDVTERKTSDDELYREKVFIEAIFESIPGYLYVYDDSGRLVRWNKNHEAMTGYTTEELSHMTMDKWFEGEDAVRVDAAVNEVFTKGYGEVEANLLLKGGGKMLIRSNGVIMNLDGRQYFTGVGIDITEQKRIENEIVETKEFFELMFNIGPDAAYVARLRDGVVVNVNEGFTRMYGYTKDDVLGRTTSELGIYKDENGRQHLRDLLWEKGGFSGQEAVFIRKDGSELTGLMSAKTFSLHGELHVTTIIHDISDRKTAERQIEDQAIRFYSLFEHMSSAAIIYRVLNDGAAGKDYIVQDINKTALTLEGKEKSQIVGKSLFELRPNIAANGLIDVFQKVWKTGDAVYFPYTTHTEKKHLKHYENRVFKLPSGDIVAVYDDVTEKVQIEAKLEESEKKYRQIAENITDVIWTTDLNLKTTFASPSVEKLFGEPAEAHLSRRNEEKFPPESLAMISQLFAEEMEKEKDPHIGKDRTRVIELQHYKADGSIIWIAMHISFLRDKDGRAVGFVGVNRDITQRMQAEQALRESEEKHRRLFETMAQGVVYQGADGAIISANPSAERILGLSLDQMMGKTSMDPGWKTISEDGIELPGPEHPAMIALRTGKPAGPSVMGVYHPKLKDHIWLSVNAIPLFRPGETVPYQVYATMQDITAERKANREYKTLFNQMVDGFALHEIICDDAGKPVNYRYLAVNPAFEKMTGVKAEDIIGKTVLDVLPDTELYWIDTYGRVALTGKDEYFENYAASLDKYFEVTAYQPAPYQFACTFTDITARVKAQQEMKAALARLRSLLDNSPNPIFIMDEDGLFVEVSAAISRILGLPEEEIRGKSIMQLLPNQNAKAHRRVIARLKKTRQPVQITETYDLQGERRTFESFLFPIETSDGHTALFGSIGIDLTDRMQADEALKESEKKYSSYIENAPDGVFVTDEKGRFIEVNKAAVRMTGYSKEQLLKMTVRDITTEEFMEDALSVYESLKAQGTMHSVLRYKLKDGSKRWWTVDSVKLSETRFLGYSKDVTQRKEAEEDLLHLSYLDQLTGLYNRRFFEEELKRLDTERNLPLTIAMADVNGLKLINDSFGHAAGDLLLKKTADAIKRGCRADDIAARLGGDEFVVILPKTDTSQAEQIIGRLESLISEESVESVTLSVSFGSQTKKRADENIQDIFTAAENNMYKHKVYESSSMRSKTIEIVMNTLFEKSNRELMHSKRVSELCETIARKMQLDKDTIRQVKTAGLVHDIGKIGIIEGILNKTARLNQEEWKEMKKHPESGWRILISASEFSELADFVLEHHERWDGKGYPKKLKEDEISLEARIIAIADSYDVMTSERPYSKALNKEEAEKEIKRCAGTQFDPYIAEIFIETILKEK